MCHAECFWTSKVLARLWSLQLSPTREVEIVDELSQHLEGPLRRLDYRRCIARRGMRAAVASFRSGNVLAQRLARLRRAHVIAPVALGAPNRPRAQRSLARPALCRARVQETASFWALAVAIGVSATTAILARAAPTGTYELFDRAGKHPRTNQDLLPITVEVARSPSSRAGQRSCPRRPQSAARARRPPRCWSPQGRGKGCASAPLKSRPFTSAPPERALVPRSWSEL